MLYSRRPTCPQPLSCDGHGAGASTPNAFHGIGARYEPLCAARRVRGSQSQAKRGNDLPAGAGAISFFILRPPACNPLPVSEATSKVVRRLRRLRARARCVGGGRLGRSGPSSTRRGLQYCIFGLDMRAALQALAALLLSARAMPLLPESDEVARQRSASYGKARWYTPRRASDAGKRCAGALLNRPHR